MRFLIRRIFWTQRQRTGPGCTCTRTCTRLHTSRTSYRTKTTRSRTCTTKRLAHIRLCARCSRAHAVQTRALQRIIPKVDHLILRAVQQVFSGVVAVDAKSLAERTIFKLIRHRLQSPLQPVRHRQLHVQLFQQRVLQPHLPFCKQLLDIVEQLPLQMCVLIFHPLQVVILSSPQWRSVRHVLLAHLNHRERNPR